MYNYNSFYKHYANKTLDWLPSDTSERYEENLRNKLYLLQSNNWINNHFKYKFNSHGFRCEEFTDEPTAMFLGCSYTIGIGLPVEKIWPELVAKELNLRCANLGIGGGSCDAAFRLCLGYIDIIKPKVVMFMIPPGIRYELVTDKSVTNILAALSTDDFTKQWSVDDNNNYFNQQKNLLGIEMLCQNRGIKFMSIHHGELHTGYSLARDLMHVGIDGHLALSKKIIERF